MSEEIQEEVAMDTVAAEATEVAPEAVEPEATPEVVE